MANGEDELYFCYGCMNQLQAGQTVCPHCGYDNSSPHNREGLLPEGMILQGKYLVGKVMGQGGFGVTYLGCDLILQVRVAIKEYFLTGISTRSTRSAYVYAPTNEENSNFYARGLKAFQREAVTLARFSSPYIVRVRDFFPANGTAYIIMDYVPGDDLGKYTGKAGGKLPWDRVLELFEPLIRELAKLHEQKLIHRDIKPANIKVVPAGSGEPEHLVLLDFGAARNFSGDGSNTMTAYITRGFAPVEQHSSRGNQGPFTDVYALCATMYACITGVVPPSSMDIMLGADQLKHIRDFGLGIPENICQAIMHGLGLKPEDRTHDMDELYRELYQSEADSENEVRKQTVYESALQTMAAGTLEGYQEAQQLLSLISGFKDADQKAAFCAAKAALLQSEQKQREEQERGAKADPSLSPEQLYQTARKAMETDTVEGYQEAYHLLTRIPGYKDADQLAAFSRENEAQAAWRHGLENQAAEDPKPAEDPREETYQQGKHLMQQAKTAADYTRAEQLLKPLSGYKDADYLVTLCQRKSHELRSGKPAEKKETHDGPPKEEKPKKSKKGLWILLIILACCAAFYFLVLSDFGSDDEKNGGSSTKTPAAATSVPSAESSDSPAELYRKGKAEYDQGNYTEALKYLVPAAEGGNADALFRLGYMYANAQGVARNDMKAVEYYRLAADQGMAAAQNNLGYMYQNGYGVDQDYARAVGYFRQAADQGSSDAQYNLGLMYENGQGVTKSAETALYYYQLAADQGHEKAIAKVNSMQKVTPAVPGSASAGSAQYGTVNVSGDIGTYLRQTPATDGIIIRTVKNGERLEITGSRKYSDSRYWLPVRTDDGRTGWVLETSLKTD